MTDSGISTYAVTKDGYAVTTAFTDRADLDRFLSYPSHGKGAERIADEYEFLAIIGWEHDGFGYATVDIVIGERDDRGSYGEATAYAEDNFAPADS